MGKVIYGSEVFYGRQHTIAQDIELFGYGLMTGEVCSVRLKPLPEDSGIIFRVNGEDVKLSQNTTFPGFHNLCLRTSSSPVLYIEHLLATLFALGVDNVLVIVEGLEIPFFDGSALVFAERLIQVGLEEQDALKRYGVIIEKAEIRDGERSIVAYPSGEFSVKAEYVSPTGEVEEFLYDFNTLFIDDVSAARTFIYEQDLKNALESNMFKGGNLDCAVIFRGDKTLNTELRFPNERVRHKLLDFFGDIFSLGIRLIGSFHIRSSSHKLVREFLKNLKYVVL